MTTSEPFDVQVDRIRQYEMSCLPDDHPWRYNFTVLVSRQNDGTWLVTYQDMVLVDGDRWELKGCPPDVSREDWKARTSHDEATALRLGRKAAATVRTCNHGVREALELHRFWDDNASAVSA